LFYYSGIAFNRGANIFGNAAELAAAPGNPVHADAEDRDQEKWRRKEQERDKGKDDEKDEARSGVLFMSLFVDDNNDPRPEVPPRYIRTVVIDDGDNDAFLDKPSHVVDVARNGAKTCTIPGVPAGPGTSAIPAQS